MDEEKRDQKLTYTLKFIDDVKRGVFTDSEPSFEEVLSRVDEPTIYADDTDCVPLHSFSN